MYNECIIVLGNYQQIAVTKCEEGQGTGVVLLTARSEQSIDAMPAPINARCYFVVSHPVLFCSQPEIVCSSCCFDANAILEGLYLYSYSRISVTLQFDVVT